MSPKTEAQLRAEKNYFSKLKNISIKVEKGKREVYKKKAEAHGMSMASFIMYLVENDN